MRPNGMRNHVPGGDARRPGIPGPGNTGLGNGGMPIMPGAPSSVPNAMNVFNNGVPFQNNLPGLLPLGQQLPFGVGGQNGFPGINAVPGQFGSNTGMPDANQIKMALQTLQGLQFLPNVMHNLNQLLLLQNASRPPVLPNCFLAPANPNPPQIPFILSNPQYDLAHQFLQNQPQLNPNSGQPWRPGNQTPPSNSYSSPPSRLQENRGSKPGMSPSESSVRGSHVKNFSRNMSGDPLRQGAQMSNFRQNNNGKRNFRSHNDRGQGNRNKFEGRFAPRSPTDQVKDQRRTLYSEQEIHQWREERRKNYPSEANMKKKLEDRCARETEMKARREELKKILAKQAELGCEVAEIPSHYLTGTEGRERDQSATTCGPPNKKGRFEKRERLGRRNKRDRFNKKPRLDKLGSSLSSRKKSEPSLLRKLLSKDIQKDKSRLLQVFRFMRMNSFFEQQPGESLRFPVVIINEDQETGTSGDTSLATPSDELPGRS
ncbi:hypothetical protein MLD38_011275 [Melastoma candidum]|uniref:Uncharacterized protein n=1 Tax=Melastoma candidum TaxID=119954 RepID=A0ACB9R620_9MYRT|nr:hypothetical protein MLD38_011275 [Melastoma candidum]